MYTFKYFSPLFDNSIHTNYELGSLLVDSEFPISITKDNIVLSKFKDNLWDLTPYARKVVRLHFPKETAYKNQEITNHNIDFFKKLIVWAMYASRRHKSISAIKCTFEALRVLVKISNDNEINIEDLFKFPNVYKQIKNYTKSTHWERIRADAYEVYYDRELLGFYILTPSDIKVIDELFNYHTTKQTPFIPERIFHYTIDRCTELLEQFQIHKDDFIEIYRICSESSIRAKLEFNKCNFHPTTKRINGKRVKSWIGAVEFYTGKSYKERIKETGVDQIINGILGTRRNIEPKNLASYFSALTVVARLLIMALTGMRNDEAITLRSSCYKVHNDREIGPLSLITGRTKKTKKDDKAVWITSPLCKLAIDVLESLASLRMESANLNPKLNTSHIDMKDLKLFERCVDPWVSSTFNKLVGINENAYLPYALSAISARYKKLFNYESLVITKEDLDQALRLTPSLAPEKFQIGKPWPLSWHQLRRTFICLALGAGVSPASAAWQAKHAGPAMTMYYGNNFLQLVLDPDLVLEMERCQLEMLIVQTSELPQDDYLTLNDSNKSQMIRVITQNEENSLNTAAKKGLIAFKKTAIGCCTNPDPCPYGGWENISECISCNYAFASKSRESKLDKILELVESEIEEAPKNQDLYFSSLVVQSNAINSALSAIRSSHE